MSYSFTALGKTKAEAKKAVAAELKAVLAVQPIHTNDADIAEETAGELIDLVRKPVGNEHISVMVSGSCYGNGDELNGASLNVSVAFTPNSAGLAGPGG